MTDASTTYIKFLSYLILSYLILSYLILSYLILSYLILSYLILSYLILSYLIVSYLIVSYLTVIFASASDIDAILGNLSQDLDNLSTSFRENELIFYLKKGKTEVMQFGTSKRLSLFHDRQVNLSVNGSPINTTTCDKYFGVHLDPTLNFETHFHKIYKKAAGRVNLLRRIRSNIDTFSAQRIYQSMIMPIFTYRGCNSLGWSESRKRMIRSIEKRSLEIISPKCSPQNCDLRFLTIDN